MEFLTGLADTLFMIEHGRVALEVLPGQNLEHTNVMELYFGQGGRASGDRPPGRRQTEWITPMNGSEVASVLVSGLLLGSIYPLMGSGLSLVWTTLGIFNLGHGAFMMLGAYVAWMVGSSEGWGLGPTMGAVIAAAALAGLGSAFELLVLRPLPPTEENFVMLTVITTSQRHGVPRELGAYRLGPRIKQLERLGHRASPRRRHRRAGDAHHPGLAHPDRVHLGLAQLLAARQGDQGGGAEPGFRATPRYERFGPLRWRPRFSAEQAVNAGVLLGSIHFVSPSMGDEPLTKALIVAIFGGLGSMLGTVLGTYVIGLLEALSHYFVGLYWTPALLFVVMIVTLMVRPSGLFGRL